VWRGKPRAGKAFWGGVLALLLAAVLAGCGDGGGQSEGPTGSAPGAPTAGSDDGNGRPGSAGRTPATQPRKYVAMAVDGERHAMLAFQVYPQGGQVVGKYTMVYFSGSGDEVRSKTDFNGRGSDTGVEFDGLTDYGAVKGTFSEDRTRLTLDRTFGVEKTQWSLVSSADVFESAVKKYAKRFESCSKKHEPEPCADVAR